MTLPKFRDVERTFFIRASPKQVFHAISTAQGLRRWMLDRCVLQLQVGARYELVFQGGWTHSGIVTRVSPGKSLTLAWAWEGVPLKGTTLTMSVSPKRGGTLFKMLHSGFPRREKWTDLYGVTEWGWTYYAMNLKSVLETGHDLRSDLDG